MSLTSELRRKSSWVNLFFKERFGALTDFVKRDAGPSVKALCTEVSARDGVSPAEVGLAFDHRLRLHSGADPASAVVLSGIDRMAFLGSGHGADADRAWADAMRALVLSVPAGDDCLLARVSVVLAWLDMGFRSGGRWSPAMQGLAARCGAGAGLTWKDCVASVEDACAAEVNDLMRLVRRRHGFLPLRSAVCGPVFDGSGLVGGADADFILGNTLYEIKTVLRPRDKLPDRLRQLIGYLLLDWNDRYGLETAGFYFARQGEFVSWPAAFLIRETTGDAGTTLADLRAAFKARAEERAVRPSRVDRDVQI